MISNEMRDRLIAMAREASQNAYVPYSHFKVGAAILGEKGGIYTGCNVENASLGLTICAERNACTTMIAQGERRIAAVAIYGGEKGGEAAPCGACRQFMLEFADEALEAPLYFAGWQLCHFQLSGDLPVPIPQLCRERLTCPKKRPGRGFLGRVFIRLRCHPQCSRMS